MSEAMSSVEIEDVLSSIRRLVSEDLRPVQKPPAVVPDEKLLLTPALRVVVPEVVAVRPAPLPRLHLGLVKPPAEEVVMTLQRAVEAQGSDFESEVGDPLPPVARMEWTEDGWASTGEPEVVAEAPALESEVDAIWGDQAEVEVMETSVHAPEVVDAPDDEMSFDERILRDLVRDLIREELHGQLGERITRNVRKLVRSEIARMIAEQDLS